MISIAVLLDTSTKGIEYLIAIAALVGFLLFLRLLGGPSPQRRRDDR